MSCLCLVLIAPADSPSITVYSYICIRQYLGYYYYLLTEEHGTAKLRPTYLPNW